MEGSISVCYNRTMLHDKDIREPLFDFLEESFGKNRIFEEKEIGRSRADVMMVTEEALWGIEIKSDADTYARLERQIKDYNRFFDYNMVAVGKSHSKSVAEHVPDYWGILVIEDGEEITVCMEREPQRNPKREKTVLFRNQISMLWRPELVHIQELNAMPRYKTMSKANLILKMMEKIPADVLKRQVCQELLERDYTIIADTINAYRAEQNRPKKRKSKKARKTTEKKTE